MRPPVWSIIALAALIVAAGIISRPGVTHRSGHQPRSTAPSPVTPEPVRTFAPIGSGQDAASPATGQLSDDDAIRLMESLTDGRPGRIESALLTILTQHDTRFIAVLIELIRASQIGLIPSRDDSVLVAALQSLSGQAFGGDWPAWVEWYGGTTLTPPPGFTGWKGRLLARTDRRFAGFLKEAAPSRIRVEEVVWGGVAVDGVPALTAPRMASAKEAATYLTSQEPIFGLSINGDERAYPLRILDWHEMVNDIVGGVPVALAYCTLCGAGIVYEARASNGVGYTFGSSGLLFRSNKLMYDHQTRTLWNQLTGEAVLGPLAAQRVTLTLRPVVLTTWADWRAQHPKTHVLDIRTGYDRPYVPGVAYGGYFSAPGTMFPVWRRSHVLPPKARVFTLRLDGIPKAYPLEVLTSQKVVNDVVGTTPVVLVATRGTVTVPGQTAAGPADRLRPNPLPYSAGGEVRAYRRGTARFRPGLTPDVLLDSAGDTWRVTEEALIGPDGARSPRVNGYLAYWFGWYAFFPQTLVYQPPPMERP